MTQSQRCVAVVTGGAHGVDPALEALERQTRAPDDLAVVRDPARFRATLHEVLAGDSAWIWLLDGSIAPQPGALAALLGALEPDDSLPEPVLLASKVVTPEGSPEPRSLPVPEVFDSDLVVAAFDRRLLPIRVARRGSLLVHRSGFERWGLPRPGSAPLDDDLAWTARLLRNRSGLLVPASVAVRPAVEPLDLALARRTAANWLRLVGGDALEPREKPWFAFRLGEEAFAAACAGLAARRRA